MTDVGPSAWEDEDFNMRFAFFSRTDTEVRMRILEGRRTRLQERLDRARTSRGPAGTDRYVTELQRHSIESVERELRWLTDLIAAERAGPSAPAVERAGPPPPGSPVTRSTAPRAASSRRPAPSTKTPVSSQKHSEGEPHGIGSRRHRRSRQLRRSLSRAWSTTRTPTRTVPSRA